jgi:hypothetical protein
MKRTLAMLTVFALGCNTLADLSIQNPRYSLQNVRAYPNIALPLSASSIDFDLTLGVDNPNTVGLRLDRVDFSLFVNDSRILDSVSTQRIQIPANGAGNIQLRARADYRSIQNIFRELADTIEGNRARYELRGNAYYNTPAGPLRFPVTVHAN